MDCIRRKATKVLHCLAFGKHTLRRIHFIPLRNLQCKRLVADCVTSLCPIRQDNSDQYASILTRSLIRLVGNLKLANQTIAIHLTSRPISIQAMASLEALKATAISIVRSWLPIQYGKWVQPCLEAIEPGSDLYDSP